MANTTLKGIVLHNGSTAIITDNSQSKTGSLTILPLYGFDSDETDVFDFGGAVRLITLTGSYRAANVAALKTWIDSLDALIQGKQDASSGYPLTFVDDLRGTLKVKVLSFDSPWTLAEPTRVNWTIKIVNASING